MLGARLPRRPRINDLLLSLTVPAVVVASGVYTVCHCRRLRRSPPPAYSRRAARDRARDAVADAEAGVTDAYALLGGLYTDPPAPRPAGPAPGVNGAARAAAHGGPSLPVPGGRR
ncbi:hypothetical protein ABZ371_03955 [Streptomyces sp. NPDC005899]|uniref:hypothetical protein n=1 Tax=Streptomyces sp. NPDC005899 TaxID=3155716 RepID=UPI0033C8FFDE